MSAPDTLTEPEHPALSPRDVTRRDNAAQRLADYIAATVAAAPPLTAEQRDDLASLLHGPSTVGGGQRAS